MSIKMYRYLATIGVNIAVFAIATTCSAHFLWLKTLPTPNGKPQAFLFFGENSADEAYHFPDKLADIKVWRRSADGKRTELLSEKLETDDRNGRIAQLPSEEGCVLETATQYGVYQTMLLNYCAKHIHAPSNDKLASAAISKELKLDIIPANSDGRLQLTVLWEGKPLKGAELMVTIGDDIVEAETDENGQATLHPKGSALVGVLTHRAEEGIQGELDGKKYSNRTYYATLTFPWTAADVETAADTSSATNPRTVPALQEPLSSFGAVVADRWLYVYGGHIGNEHEHSAANLSKHFRRIRLEGAGSDTDPQLGTGGASGTQKWEVLPMQTPLQGLPIVAHGGKVYRVGGLAARNATKEVSEDLHSSAEFAEFDPATGEWTALAPLPEARSSHNAAVVGDKLYIVGGWNLTGEAPGVWQPATLAYDFNDPDVGWQTVADLPHTRRALAASQWNGKLVALGGMDENEEMSMRVDFYDPQSGQWTEGPKLPGEGIAGFGVSAWNLDGQLYVSGFHGEVYSLNEAGSQWEEVARLKTPRFFHQLVPAAGGGLFAVGGASQKGHVADIEWIDVGREVSDGAATDLEADSAEATRPSEERPPPAGQESRVESQEPDVQTGVSGSRLATFATANLRLGSQLACPSDIWPAFRGNGTSLSAARNLPLRWRATHINSVHIPNAAVLGDVNFVENENVAWDIALPGYGQSSPVVWRDAVFVTTMQGDRKETPTVLCFDLATGEKRWQREFKSSLEITASNMVTRSSPTPAVDSERLYTFFESGDLVAFDHMGDPERQRSLAEEFGDFTGLHGVGSSLAQTDDTLFVLANHEGPSYLLAIDKASGEIRWKVDYPGRVAWSSPIVHQRDDKNLVIVSAAGVVEAYDAAAGERVWKLDGLSGNTVPSATAAGDWVFIGSQEVASNMAIDLSSGQPHIAWRSDNATCNFMSPLYQDGRVYIVNRSGVAFCLDAMTGKELWKHRLPDTCWASPLGAGDRVYFFAKNGDTIVAQAGDTWQQLAANKLYIDEGTRIYGYAAVDGALIIRTGTRLICVGQPNRS